MASADVCILMSTYNGAAFLAEQLDSIVAQSVSNWCLVVRDDGSSDGTVGIIDKYCKLDPRISLLKDPEPKPIGPAQSFARLLAFAAESSYESFCFCDQDDLWHSEKLKSCLNALEGSEYPCLVADGLVPFRSPVDLPDTVTAVAPLRPGPDRFLTRNTLPGCSQLFNRKLAELALPLPASVVMHDWWVSLVGYFAGEVVYLEEAHTFYRQHSRNAIGSFSMSRALFSPGEWINNWRNGNAELVGSMAQATALAHRLRERRSEPGDDTLQDELIRYGSLPDASLIERLKVLKTLQLRGGLPLMRLVLAARMVAGS